MYTPCTLNADTTTTTTTTTTTVLLLLQLQLKIRDIFLIETELWSILSQISLPWQRGKIWTEAFIGATSKTPL